MDGTRKELPKRRLERSQGVKLAKIAKRLSFKVCGYCETRGSVYQAYEHFVVRDQKLVPLGWSRWCYVCGAKDEQTDSQERGDLDYLPPKVLRETIAMLERELASRKE